MTTLVMTACVMTTRVMTTRVMTAVGPARGMLGFSLERRLSGRRICLIVGDV